MRCHYCAADATLVVDADGVRVGLCDAHFRDRLEDLKAPEAFGGLVEKLEDQ